MRVAICTISDGLNAVYQSCVTNVVRSLDLLDHDMHFFLHLNGSATLFPGIPERLADRADTTVSMSREYRGIAPNRNALVEEANDAGCEVVIWIDDDVVVPWVEEDVLVTKDGDWIECLLHPFLIDDTVFGTSIYPCVCTEDFNTMWYIPHGDRPHYLDSPYAICVAMWESLGKYDPQFTHFCDNTDLCLKALFAGHKLVGVENTEGILHYHGRTLSRPSFMDKAALGVIRERHHETMLIRYPPGWHNDLDLDDSNIQKRARVLDYINVREVRV
tara:strand:- start:2155 stop:2976 length:822 start_codon:yes stop_codon:yes gene_type:complete